MKREFFALLGAASPPPTTSVEDTDLLSARVSIALLRQPKFHHHRLAFVLQSISEILVCMCALQVRTSAHYSPFLKLSEAGLAAEVGNCPVRRTGCEALLFRLLPIFGVSTYCSSTEVGLVSLLHFASEEFK
jgi:hypothetical protein